MRTSFKRIGAACAALAFFALPACSDGPASTGSVEILHWWKQGGEADAISALLGLYHDQYPGVTIIDDSVDGSKLARAAIGNSMSLGTPPDTFQANGGWDLMTWVLYNGMDLSQNKMQELDPASLDWLDQVPDEVLSSVSYQGKVYAVPLNIHRLNTFFYNKKVFRDAGVDIATDLQSFDGIFTVAEKIKAYNQTLPDGTPPIAPFAMGYRATVGAMATDDTWTLALLFFENILVARMGGADYHKLFLEPQVDDAFQDRVTNALADFRQLVLYSNLDAKFQPWNATLDMVLNG
jgi:glucose/mannose transport system substrate-binding protein